MTPMTKTALLFGACLTAAVAVAPAGAPAGGLADPGVQVAANRDPGKRLYLRKTCIACHGKDGKGAMLAYPNLAGQDEKYIVEQVKDIMDAKRTGSPDETGNPRSAGMRGALVTADGQPRITDDEIKQIAAWLAKMEPAPPAKPETPVDPQRVAAGEKLYTKFKCRTCHGKDGTKPLKGYPYIAGQKTEYLIAQMTDIRDKKRTNGKAKTMYPMIKKAKDDDIALLADFLASIDRTAKN
ncbi:MAG: cytochrome c4 [Hyphomicrobiales bacterium]|nr:cytochrome c4 [Hyphomicrobiales bacterium]MCP5371181.1 cytochrome c4 [Hyphomicrobiales bacterium]